MPRFQHTLLATALISASAAHATITSTSYEDIADSAVWQSKDAKQSLLISTLEGDGIAVYDASGQEVQHIEGIEALGADVRYGLRSKDGQKIDLVAVGLPDEDVIAFYQINGKAKAPLTEVGRLPLEITPEGVCLGKNATSGDMFVASYDEDGNLVQYKLKFDGKQVSSAIQHDGKPTFVRAMNVGGELSGCAMDDETNTLYVAEQNVGVWVYGADPENVKDRALLDVVAPHGQLEEIENLDIVYQAHGKGAIVIADEGQGFVLYDRVSHEFLGKFDIEGVEEGKLVSASSQQLWIGNTELDEPVYQTLSWAELETLSGYKAENTLSPRELEIKGVELVRAHGETKAVDNDGDAADDPALWYNAESPKDSLIIATNKKGGLMAYDLQGNEIQYLEGGKPNNVDIRQDVADSEGNTIALAAASNRKKNTVTLYTIDGSSTPIKPLPATQGTVHPEASELLSSVDEVYGLCMSRGEDGTPYVFVNGKDGHIEQWRISVHNGEALGKVVRTLNVPSQPEGCVVDDRTQTLYVGEEDHAIWAFDAREDGSIEGKIFAKVDGQHLVDDIEGLTLYQTNEQNLLIASSQGNNTYAAFDLNDQGKFVKSFAIIGDDERGTDGATDTDGIHAVSQNLGDEFPRGLFLAQDWNNIDRQYKSENQNFKIVDWRDIQAVLK
ncbi:3-phytase precursor [Marinomonas aquimarina]|uniref:3-phytase n=1 Tax=Marinomonas aquimarina TaxID=295068 RepID=A0A1A8T9C8_9GAMM|nr:phytase [Marinomonas aquimarina]SBS29053.1 3-phytase precursor [Marinomonas aquimarina]